jgi:sugar phosphate isomerase/epimerase
MNKFLFATLIISVLLVGNIEAQSRKALFPNTPGMVSYTYRDSFKKDVAATLDTLQAMGIKDMEFSNLFGKTAADIRTMLDKRDMLCSSFGVSYADLMEKTDQVGANAQTLGAKYVRVAWIPHTAPFDLAAAEKAITDFNAVGKVLKEKYDLTFCYHNHVYEFHPHEDGTLFDLMIQKTDPKYVSYEMDILWTFFPGADPVEYLEKYGDRFPLMHLKDLRKGVEGNMSGGTPVENDVALGTGQLDIPAILVAAKKAKVKHYYIEDESPVYYKQVPQSMEYLKSLKK